MSLAPKVHTLKTEARFYDAIEAGLKPFEVRFNDRDYAIGDTLVLVRIVPEGEAAAEGQPCPCAAPSCLQVAVTFILDDPRYGVQPGWVVLGLGTPIKVRPGLLHELIGRSLPESGWRSRGGPVKPSIQDGRTRSPGRPQSHLCGLGEI